MKLRVIILLAKNSNLFSYPSPSVLGKGEG